MKPRVWLSVLLTSLLVPGTEARDGELVLLNGDTASGRFLGLEEGILRFQASWGREPLVVPAAYTGTLLFGDATARVDGGDAQLELANGDRLTIRSPHISDEAVEGETLWGERVRARREMVRFLRFLPHKEDRIVFEPLREMDWQGLEDPGNSFRGNLLVLSSATPVSRSLPRLPDQIDMEIRVRFEGPAVNLNVDLLSDARGGNNPNVTFTLTGNMLTTRVAGDPRMGGRFFRTQVDENLQGGEVVLRLRGDLRANRLVLTINDNFSQEIDFGDGASFAGRDNMMIRLRSSQSGSQAEIESFRIWRVRGVLDSPEISDHRDFPHDLLFLPNGDRVEARGVTLREGELAYESMAGRVVRMQASRVREIHFGYEGEIPVPRRLPRDTVLWLEGYSDKLTLGVWSWDADLKGSNDQWFSSFRVPTDWIQRARFNPYVRFRHDTEPRGLDPRAIFL